MDVGKTIIKKKNQIDLKKNERERVNKRYKSNSNERKIKKENPQ